MVEKPHQFFHIIAHNLTNTSSTKSNFNIIINFIKKRFLVSCMGTFLTWRKGGHFHFGLTDYINGNLHYVYYFANIINNKEFTEELEKVDFIKRENAMGAVARKIEQEGIEKGIKKTALSMVREGLYVTLINKVTNLTIEEINALKEE